MADGSTKNIEDIQVGDQVLDYKLQPQTVLGVNVKHLHSSQELVDINGKLEINSNYPLLGVDGNFYLNLTNHSNDPIYHIYIAENNLMKRIWTVFPANLLKQSYIGMNIKTVTGSEVITSMETVDHPTTFDERTVYMLHVSGNGTYFVNGFCVNGNFNMEWDYENDRAFTETATIILNHDESQLSRHGITYRGSFQRVLNFDTSNSRYDYWSNDLGIWLYANSI